MRSPSHMIARIDNAMRYLLDVRAGLKGTPFSWRGCDAQHGLHVLRKHGIELVTRTAAKRRGHALKRGVRPVGRMYFRSPISAYHDVFVLGVQTKAEAGGTA